jgi:tetratricopeptide (TPR) repeat protein
MTRWIQPSDSLAQQLDVPAVPLPVEDATAAMIEEGRIDLTTLARDVDIYLAGADPADPKAPALARCAAALGLVAANQHLDQRRYDLAAELLRLAASHAPDDTGIRASYGSALWMAGNRFEGLAQLTRAVHLNQQQGLLVPMLWISTAQALADAGRHGDALLLLEDLAATGPTDIRFWELIDSIDARGTGVRGGYRPHHAEAVRDRLDQATAKAASTEADAVAAVSALGMALGSPTPAPPLCLEVLASGGTGGSGSARPGTLGMLDATVGVVRTTESPAPTRARSTVAIKVVADAGSAHALAAVNPHTPPDAAHAEGAIDAVARCVAAFPPDPDQAPDPFHHDLDAGSSMALAAHLDLIGVAAGVTVSALVEHASAPALEGMRSMMRSLLGLEPSAQEVREGVDELRRRGFVHLDSGTVEPTPYFSYLVDHLGIALSWQRFTHHDSHARSVTRRHYLAAADGVLRLGPTGAGVSWSICRRADMQAELGVELAMIAS